MSRPAGAVGFVPPSSPIGRIIAWRQGVPFSHAIVALGNGKVLDSTVPYTRVTDEAYWAKKRVQWFDPQRKFTPGEARVLRSLAHFVKGRIKYNIWSLIMFVLRGVPGKRTHGLFCTYLVAECYMTVRNIDLSGCEQPWNMDVRELLLAVARGPFASVQ